MMLIWAVLPLRSQTKVPAGKGMLLPGSAMTRIPNARGRATTMQDAARVVAMVAELETWFQATIRGLAA